MKIMITRSGFLILMIFLNFHFTCAQTLYSQYLGVAGTSDNVHSAIHTSDGNILITGFQSNLFDNLVKSFVAKADENGNPIWIHQIKAKGKPFYDQDLFSYDVIETADGYISAGYMNTDHDNAVLTKYKPDGTVKWFKRYELQGSHFPSMELTNLTQTPDGNLVATGITGQGHSKPGMLWMKADANGENPQFKSIYGERDLNPVSIFPQADNGVVIAVTAGKDFYSDHGVYPVFYKLDQDGNVISYRKIFISKHAALRHCERTPDNGFIMVLGIDPSSSNYYLVKLNSSFDVEWTKSYNSPLLELNTATADPAGGYFVGGMIAGFNLVIKTDENGNVTYSKELTTQGSVAFSLLLPAKTLWLSNLNNGNINFFHSDESGATACSNSDAGLTANAYLIVGFKDFSEQLSFPQTDFQFMKDSVVITSDYEAGEICSPVFKTGLNENTMSEVMVYPNPARDYLVMNIPTSTEEDDAEIFILNTEGQLMAHFEHQNGNLNIPLSSWSTGLYHYLIRSVSGSQSQGKFVIQ